MDEKIVDITDQNKLTAEQKVRYEHINPYQMEGRLAHLFLPRPVTLIGIDTEDDAVVYKPEGDHQRKQNLHFFGYEFSNEQNQYVETREDVVPVHHHRH